MGAEEKFADQARDLNILLVGPGALGTYFAARLGRVFTGLRVLDHNPVRAAQLQDRGFHVTGATVLDWSPPEGHVSAHVKGWPVMDVALFLVKAPALKAAAERAAPVLGPKTVWVCLQNGWNPEAVLRAKVPTRRLALGVTQEAVTLESPGRAFHAASGPTLLDADCPMAVAAAKLLQRAGLHARAVKNFEKERWMKLVQNACINPLAALAGVSNGRLGEPPLAGLLDQALAEIVRLSAALNHRVSLAEARTRVHEVVRRTHANRNSLLQDILRGRATERPFLLGPFLQAARRKRISAPVLTALDRLLQGVERLPR